MTVGVVALTQPRLSSVGCSVLFVCYLGVTLAIFLDQKIRAEGALRTIYLTLSGDFFIVHRYRVEIGC